MMKLSHTSFWQVNCLSSKSISASCYGGHGSIDNIFGAHAISVP
ncbi:MAG: hypothetical protein ACOX60_02095 [Massiliimalia sp.]